MKIDSMMMRPSYTTTNYLLCSYMKCPIAASKKRRLNFPVMAPLSIKRVLQLFSVSYVSILGLLAISGEINYYSKTIVL